MKNPDPFGCSPMSMRTEALVNSSETPPGIDLCFRRGRWRGTGRLVALPEQPHLEGRVGRPLDQEGRQLTALDTYVDAELDLGLFGCDFHDGTGHRVRDSADRATYVIECERLISAATEDTDIPFWIFLLPCCDGRLVDLNLDLHLLAFEVSRGRHDGVAHFVPSMLRRAALLRCAPNVGARGDLQRPTQL